MTDGYDVIGDVHGEHGKLIALLVAMGYAHRDGAWRHPTRTAVFVGDFIDRGTGQVETYRTVRDMVEGGAALAIAGNHELNAVAFHTLGPDGVHMRERTARNMSQHRTFLDQVGIDSALHAEMVDWFLDLPLWLEIDGIRLVHACWDDDMVAALRPLLRPGNRLSREILPRVTSGRGNAWDADGTGPDEDIAFRAVETLLKGVELKLPPGLSYHDSDGHPRTATRVRWWDDSATTYRQAALMPHGEEKTLPDLPVPAGVLKGYHHPEPLFIGHYWMTGAPAPLTTKIACTDYSAARNGPMAAYRWSGESVLAADNYVTAG